MTQINLLQEDVQPVITRMPAVEFMHGRVGDVELFVHEIQLSEHMTLVLDEQQLILLVEAALDRLPPQWDLKPEDEADDKGEEWKQGGARP